MTKKTDAEILALKRKLEAKGFTWEKYPTDEAWIERYRYVYAPFNVRIKRGWDSIKQWVTIHPKATVHLVGVMVLVGILLYPALTAIQVGGKIINSEAPATLTLAQLNGFVFLLAGGLFLILAGAVGWIFLNGNAGVVADDEKAYQRKLRREELAKSTSVTSVTRNSQTGEAKNQ